MTKEQETVQHTLTNRTEVITFDHLRIDESKILRIQGYKDRKSIRPVIKRAAASTARLTETLIRPAIYYRSLTVHSYKKGLLRLSDGSEFENEAFDRYLIGVKKIVAFILTMGHPLDQAVKDSIANDQLLDALLLETAGWLGIEAATKKFSLTLRSLALKESCRLSPRLGPGYSYKLNGRSVVWPLDQQHTLFKLFDDQDIDVELLDSSVMLPKISRSGIFGLLPNKKD